MVAQNIINDPYLVSYFGVTGLDFKTVAVTTIYTVPAGKSLIIIGTIIEATNYDTATLGGFYNLGTNAAAYDNIENGTASLPMSTGNSLVYATGTSEIIVVPAGGVIKVNVTTGVTATAAIGNYYIYGILK
jgi:hypothetical protein